MTSIPQAAQAVFAFAADGFALHAAGKARAFRPRRGALGKHIRRAGAALDGAADNLFGMAKSIDRRGVDPVDAAVERGVDGADGVVVVLRSPGEGEASAADGPRANAERRDL